MQHAGTEAQGCLMMEAHEKDSRDPWTGKMEGQRMLHVGSSELGLQELELGKAGIEVYLTGSSTSASMGCLCYSLAQKSQVAGLSVPCVCSVPVPHWRNLHVPEGALFPHLQPRGTRKVVVSL